MQLGQVAFLIGWPGWPAVHDWLERWAPLADWAVAAGTIGLALATYAVARSTRAEAKAVGKEVTQLTEQAQASLRAYVYPESTAEWVWGLTGYTTSLSRGVSNRILPLRNGGPGVALNVEGHVKRRTQGDRIALFAGSIAPGHTIEARPEQEIEGGWAGWTGTWHGELRYDDLDDAWITRFTIAVSADRQIVVEHGAPSWEPAKS